MGKGKSFRMMSMEGAWKVEETQEEASLGRTFLARLKIQVIIKVTFWQLRELRKI